MKRFLILLLTSMTLFLSATANATPVGPMNYQGRLLDDNGIPVTGSYNFVIKIYNDPAAGTLKYQEDRNSVLVDDGVYAFKIGMGPKTGGDSSWDIDLWQGNLNDLYLEVVVNGETLSPRHELTSAPHAFTSTFALSANALGNKTAAEYDNILEGVCVASKGKWLDSLNKCLGSGAVITNQAIPDSDGLDYSNLELIDVDLTGTSFPANAYFHKTIFKDSTISFSGFPASADLSEAYFDNISVASPLTSNAATYGATFKNMNMSGFIFSGSNLWQASAAELSACPSSLPTGYGCREQFTGTGRYFIYGPSMNFSKTSALAASSNSGTVLQLRADAFSGAAGLGHSLQSANFSGVRIPSHLSGLSLTLANFTDAVLDRIDLSNCNLNNSNFDRARISQVNFTNASMGFITFKNAEISLTSMSNGNYTDAKLDKVILTGINNQSTFSNTVISDSSLAIGFLDPVLFSNTLFLGTIRLQQGTGLNSPYLSNTTFNNCTFRNATLISEIRYTNTTANPGLVCQTVTFSNSTFRGFEMRFNQSGIPAGNLVFTNNTFGATVFSGNMTNASFSGSSVLPGVGLFDGVMFKNGTICPNGATQNNANGDYHVCGTAGQGQTNW